MDFQPSSVWSGIELPHDQCAVWPKRILNSRTSAESDNKAKDKDNAGLATCKMTEANTPHLNHKSLPSSSRRWRRKHDKTRAGAIKIDTDVYQLAAIDRQPRARLQPTAKRSPSLDATCEDLGSESFSKMDWQPSFASTNRGRPRMRGPRHDHDMRLEDWLDQGGIPRQEAASLWHGFDSQPVQRSRYLIFLPDTDQMQPTIDLSMTPDPLLTRRVNKVPDARERKSNPIVAEGMKFSWLLDIPAEIRHHIYRCIFEDKVYQVHDPAAHPSRAQLAARSHAIHGMGWGVLRTFPYESTCNSGTRRNEDRCGRRIFQCSRKVYEEASAVALQTALYDVRPCRKSNCCKPLSYLTSRSGLLSQMTRILCHAGDAPQVLHLARALLGQSTNVCRLQDINISYNLRTVAEILGLAEPNTRDSFRALYRKLLSKQLKKFLRLFAGSGAKIILYSQRSRGEFKGICETLSLSGNKAVVRLRDHNASIVRTEEELRMEDCLKQLVGTDTLEATFEKATDGNEKSFVRCLDFDTSLASI